MAHFAQLDQASKVLRVVVVAESEAPDELTGIAFCNALFGTETVWVQTSYNANIRKRYAGTGMTYDAQRDVFIESQPYGTWTLDGEGDWCAPVAKPQDGAAYWWNEAALQWQVRQPFPPPG